MPVSAEALPKAEPRESRGLVEQAAALAAGEVTARELTERALARIAATQPTLNAFRHVREDEALAEADAADRELARGERRALLGVPVAVKDDMDVAGLPTAFGCPGDFPRKEADSEAVRKLRAAGAVIVGKTNSPELGQWPFTEGPAFGDTRNPWSLDHTPGGSSGRFGGGCRGGAGSGCARFGRRGLHPYPGSLEPSGRHQAAARPDLDAARPGVVQGDHRLRAARPYSRGTRRCCWMWPRATWTATCTGREPVDVAPAAGRDPGRLRIALSLRPPFTATRKSLDPVVRAAVTRLADRLAALGHEVEEADPDYGLIGLTFVPRATAGVREWSLRAPDPALLDPRTRGAARTGRMMDGPLLRAARAAEAPLQRRVGRIFRRFDVVLAPTTATPPAAHRRPRDAVELADGPHDDRPLSVRMAVERAGLAGRQRACWLYAHGLPVGAQLLGPASAEPLLVSLAAQLEADQRWFERRPPERGAAARRASGVYGRSRSTLSIGLSRSNQKPPGDAERLIPGRCRAVGKADRNSVAVA